MNRDRLYGHTKTTKNWTKSLKFCRYLRSLYPPEVRLAIVMDNDSPHVSIKKDTRVGEWAEANNLELADVPTNTSFLNRIECHFTALRYFALNDGAAAETTRILLGPEDQSLAHPDRFDDVRLYNLAEYIPEGRRYSREVRSARELIDHILVSHELMFPRPEVDSHVEPVMSITESVESRRDAVYPDHVPVFATFALEP